MLIKNKWVIHETHDDGYFIGHSNGFPLFESLSSRTRTYQTKGYAMKAISKIKKVECQEYAPEYIENIEVPDVPKNKPKNEKNDQQKEPPIIKNDGGWETVDSFGKKGQVQYLRKREALRYIFAVQCEDGELRGFGFDEKRAWTWYSNYRRDIGVRRIEERPGKQQITEGRNAEK